MAIPSLIHKLTLGDTSFSLLRKIDKRLRAALRKWYDLPHDYSTSYIHASIIVDGGLGTASLRLRALLDRLGRLKRLKASLFIVESIADLFLGKSITAATHRLNIDGRILDKSENFPEYLAKNLTVKWMVGRWRLLEVSLPSVDGLVVQPNSYMKEISSDPSRPGSIRSRTSQGRPATYRSCHGGCGRPETLNHVIQNRTLHPMRTKKNDAG